MFRKDIIIKATIPYLGARTVLLIEDPERPIPVPHEGFWEEVKYGFKRAGYKFIFLPEVLSGIRPEVAEYLFPGFEVPDAAAIYRQIRDLAGIGPRYGFLYKIGRYTYFKDLSVPGTDIGNAIRDLMERFYDNVEAKVKPRGIEHSSKAFGRMVPDMMERRLEPIEYIPECPETGTDLDFSITGAYEEELDNRANEILDSFQRFLREHNLTYEELKVIIGYKVKLSHMEITPQGKIFLTGFTDKETGKPKEIKMDALTRMVYFFYLKHPEGVRIKEVGDHIEELMHLYMGITGRDDKDAIRASILGHVDPFGNRINVSISRVKSAFKNEIGEDVARFYWIEGKSGEPYKIAIDRDYVIWKYVD